MPRRTISFPVVLAAVAALALLAFVLLTAEVREPRPLGWEGDVFGWMAGLEDPLFEAPMVCFAFLGAGVGLLLLLSGVVFWLIREGRVPDAAFVLLALLVAQFAGRIVKSVVERPRPEQHDHELLLSQSRLRDAVLIAAALALAGALATRRHRPALMLFAIFGGTYGVFELAAPLAVDSEGWAFPSGHATSSMAFASAVVLVTRRSRHRAGIVVLAVAFVVGVGLSRVAFGVHNASDVLGGWSLAIATTLLLGVLHEQYRHLVDPTPTWLPREDRAPARTLER